MKSENLILRTALGALGGVIGTVAIFSALAANKKLAPATEAPMKEDPGQFIIETAENAALTKQQANAVPKIAEKVVGSATHLSYGAAGGALYALLRPKTDNLVLEGAALGTALWAVGYLGWLPAVGLLPPVTEQKPIQIFTPIWQHALYGVVTVAAYEQLQKLAE